MGYHLDFQVLQNNSSSSGLLSLEKSLLVMQHCNNAVFKPSSEILALLAQCVSTTRSASRNRNFP